jgi:hypothetical protein
MVSHLTPEDDLAPLIMLSIEVIRVGGTGVRRGRDNIHILQLKWGSGKMKKLATFGPCPLPTLPVVFPIESQTMCATGLAIHWL